MAIHDASKPTADGPGPALVFLHAAIGDRRMWHPQWSHFAATNPLVRIDMRGFGENPPATEPFRRSDDVMAVLDAEGIEQAIFVGGSMGGRVALDVAIDHPERTLALMLVGAAGPKPRLVPRGAEAVGG